MGSESVYLIPNSKDSFRNDIIFTYGQLVSVTEILKAENRLQNILNSAVNIEKAEESASYIFSISSEDFEYANKVFEYMKRVDSNLLLDIEYTYEKLRDFLADVLLPDTIKFMKDINEKNKGKLIVSYGNNHNKREPSIIEISGNQKPKLEPKLGDDYFYIDSIGKNRFRCYGDVKPIAKNRGEIRLREIGMSLKDGFEKFSELYRLVKLKPVFEMKYVKYIGDGGNYAGCKNYTRHMKGWMKNGPLNVFMISRNELFNLYKSAM
ncbi:MAG: hypothetical protein GXO64_01010 [Candidatus Micrarchaeota archaeon]|nr:hypothetical protein [Candidatus Micrarchaeota archaeon]